MSNKLFWLVIGIIAVAMIGALTLSNNNDSTPDTDSDSAIAARPLILSSATSNTVTLTEYSDFQCPACVTVHPFIERARNEFKETVTFEFRHFPLTEIHPNALTAHRIAQAADTQDKFVEIHDLLFSQNQAWVSASNPTDAIYGIIETANIDIDSTQLRTDAESSESMSAINADIKNGKNAGVTGTPSLFVNGEQINITSYESLKTQLEQAISDATAEQAGESE